MRNHPIFLFLIAAIFFALAFKSWENGADKIASLSKAKALETVSTGFSSVSVSDATSGEFVEHRLGSGRFGNMLYQGFVAFHFTEDSLLVRNSPFGRTVGGRRAGDSSDVENISRNFFEDDIAVRSEHLYSFKGLKNRVRIAQVAEAPKDSTNGVRVRFIVELLNNGVDSVFSDVRFMFGYDGDIGPTTGGYADDSCGVVGDSINPLVYVFDDSLSLFSGFRVTDATGPVFVANRALWHQDVNRDGRTGSGADSLALAVMTSPFFTKGLGNTDVSLFVGRAIGSVTVKDTLRDTLDLLFVNGQSLADVENAPSVLKGSVAGSGISATKDFQLKPNYPNPFNPSTVIVLNVAVSQTFEIEIYNALGQKVRNLFNDALLPGEHRIPWDGTNNRGTRAGSGMYIVRVQGASSMQTSKMLLIR